MMTAMGCGTARSIRRAPGWRTGWRLCGAIASRRGWLAWGGTDKKLNWHAAATRGGNAVLTGNPKLLVMVEGRQYSTDFRAAAHLPIVLKVPGHAVYSPHAYSFGAQQPANYAELKQAFDERAGFLLQTTPAIPLWIGEFGTCQSRA